MYRIIVIKRSSDDPNSRVITVMKRGSTGQRSRNKKKTQEVNVLWGSFF